MREILSILTVFLNSAINFLPKLVSALILLVIGWIVGVVVGKIVKEILVRLKVDQYLARGKKPVFKLSEIFSLIFRWAIYLTFIQAAVQTLGITALVSVVGAILGFIPGLVEAIIVIIAGYAIGEYARKQIVESKIMYSDVVAKVIFFLIMYVAVGMALPLVGIDATLVNNILLIIVGSVGLGLAIAIGLGLKDTVAAIAKKMIKKKFR